MNGLYCSPKMVKCVRTQAVILPQPATSDIVHVQRNYSNMGDYKRRITWINSSDDEQQLAFYEYLGKLILTMFTMRVLKCLACNKHIFKTISSPGKIRVGVKYSSSSTQIHQVLSLKAHVRYMVHKNTRGNFNFIIFL